MDESASSAVRLPPAEDAGRADGRHVLFHAGGVPLAVEIQRAVRIVRPLPVTRVPGTPACLEGVINLEHDIVPVVRLGRWLGAPETPGTPERARLLLVEVDDQVLGLRVDSVDAICVLPDAGRGPAPAQFHGADGSLLSAVCATAERDEGPVGIPNLALLLAQVRVESPYEISLV